MATVIKAKTNKTSVNASKAAKTEKPSKTNASATDVKNDKGIKGKVEKTERKSVYNIAGYNSHFSKDAKSIGKPERTAIRKKRDSLIKGIISAGSDKGKASEAIKAFKDFYKSVYMVTDFSPESLAASNADEDTKANIKLALEVIKRSKP